MAVKVTVRVYKHVHVLCQELLRVIYMLAEIEVPRVVPGNHTMLLRYVSSNM